MHFHTLLKKLAWLYTLSPQPETLSPKRHERFNRLGRPVDEKFFHDSAQGRDNFHVPLGAFSPTCIWKGTCNAAARFMAAAYGQMSWHCNQRGSGLLLSVCMVTFWLETKTAPGLHCSYPGKFSPRPTTQFEVPILIRI